MPALCMNQVGIYNPNIDLECPSGVLCALDRYLLATGCWPLTTNTSKRTLLVLGVPLRLRLCCTCLTGY